MLIVVFCFADDSRLVLFQLSVFHFYFVRPFGIVRNYADKPNRGRNRG